MIPRILIVVLTVLLLPLPSNAQPRRYVSERAMKVAAGAYHVVALRPNGTVTVYSYDPLVVLSESPAAVTGAIDVAAGCYYWAALLSSGTVAIGGAFGRDLGSPPPGHFSDVVALAGGCAHLVGLRSDGSVVTWPEAGGFVVPSSVHDAVAIAAGLNYTVVLRQDGTLQAYGAIGPPPPGRFVAVAGNSAYPYTGAMALAADGSVVIWNDYATKTLELPTKAVGIAPPYVLLDDGTVFRNSVGRLPDLDDVVAISAGGDFPEILAGVAGAPAFVVSWGSPLADSPSQDVTFKAVAVGSAHAVGLRPDGTVMAWGSNAEGQTAIPAGLGGVKAIAAGCSHTLALKSDGTVVAWGGDLKGQSSVPAGLGRVKAIAAGCSHSLALQDDGQVVTWGGDLTLGDVPSHPVAAITAAGSTSFARRADGTVVQWGGGALTPPLGLTGIRSLAPYHAVKSDGTVEAWGRAAVPADLGRVRDVVASADGGVAIKDDGTLAQWSTSTLPALPEDPSWMLSVATGADTRLAIRRPLMADVWINMPYAGMPFTVDGQEWSGFHRFSWPVGSRHTISAPEHSTARGGAAFTFASWSDGGDRAHEIVVADTTTRTIEADYTADSANVVVFIESYPPSLVFEVDGVSESWGEFVFAEGSQHTFSTASPQGPYVLDRVTSSLGEQPTPSFSFTATKDLTWIDATFVKDSTPKTITVATQPPGLTFSIDGSPFSSSQTVTKLLGDSVVVSTVAVQTLNGVPYVFTGWSDGGKTLTRTLTVPQASVSYTALFTEKTVAVDISTDPTGLPFTVDGQTFTAPTTLTWVSGSNHTVSVSSPLVDSSNTHYVLKWWESAGCTINSGATITVSATQSCSVLAKFELEYASVTVQTNPPNLTVTLGASTGKAPLSDKTMVGATRKIFAASPQSPAPGVQYEFLRWSDGGAQEHVIEVPSGGATFTAEFRTLYQLTVAVSPAGAGTVSPTSGGYYAAGSQVPVSATPGEGFQFQYWAGAPVVGSAVAINGPTTLIAHFLRTTTTSLVAATGQYTDPVTLRGRVSPACAGNIHFFLDDQLAGIGAVNGATGEASLAVVSPAPGSNHALRAQFEPGAGSGCASSSVTGTLTVVAEDTTVTPAATNPFAVPVTSGGYASGVVLQFLVQQDADGHLGDITKARLAVDLQPVTGSLVTCGTVTVNSEGIVSAVCPSLPVNVYDVRATVEGGFYRGSTASVLAVYDPSAGGLVGAGALRVNGVLTHVALQVKYLKNGQPQGSVLVAQRGASSNTVKSTALQSVSIVGDTGIVLSKATLNGAGNYNLRLVATRGGTTAAPQIGLQVFSPNGAVVPDLTFPSLPLVGGTIQMKK